MTADEFQKKQYDLSVTAGMNQRYHQRRAGRFAWWDRGFRVGIGVLSAVSAGLAVAAANNSVSHVEGYSVAIAIVVAGIGATLNVLPFGDWEKSHVDLFRRWTDLREEVDALLYHTNGEPSAFVISRLKELDGKLHRICGMEPACKTKLLDECHRAEERSRGVDAACAA